MPKQDSTRKNIEDSVRRTTYSHPFITKYIFTVDDENRFIVKFSLGSSMTDELIREFGRELYESLRNSGYLVNIIFEEQTSNEMIFVLAYSGIQKE